MAISEFRGSYNKQFVGAVRKGFMQDIQTLLKYMAMVINKRTIMNNKEKRAADSPLVYYISTTNKSDHIEEDNNAKKKKKKKRQNICDELRAAAAVVQTPQEASSSPPGCKRNAEDRKIQDPDAEDFICRFQITDIPRARQGEHGWSRQDQPGQSTAGWDGAGKGGAGRGTGRGTGRGGTAGRVAPCALGTTSHLRFPKRWTAVSDIHSETQQI